MDLERDGFCLVRRALTDADCDRLLAEWSTACAAGNDGLMRSATGAVYGARNILDRWPAVLRVIDQPELLAALRDVLGDGFGLVRVLYFDKPPGESWALPWHKDLAIAVRDNRRPSAHFDRPTTKYGVPHVEAPTWLLERMLTARLHLDEVTDENGPLRVLPGSHRDGKAGAGNGNEVRIVCGRGDVLLMRPLLSHGSGHSLDGTTRHRRVSHFEFSPVRELPDGYEWHTFIPPATTAAPAAGRNAG
jgi:ectoine hydroxylase-related dioxygenase (phytanoyl-CoA dioxygenase family)